MAKAVKLPSGSWRVRVYKGKDANGKQLFESITAPTKKLAEMEAALFTHKRAQPMTLGEAIDKYIEIKEKVLSPSTVLGYKKLWRTAYASIIDTRLDKLNEEKIQQAISQYAANHSPKSTRNASGLLSSVMKLYAPGITYKVTLPQKKKTTIHIPEINDIKKMLEAVRGTKMETVLSLAVMLGLRRSEIAALTWDDIDFKKNSVSINKAMILTDDGTWVVKQPKSTASQRVLSMPDALAEHLQAVSRYSESVVNLHPNAISGRFNRLRQKLGITCRFHDLRHHYASLMLAMGIPDKYAMAIMGHETDTTLKTVYQHLMDDKRKEVDEAINQRMHKLFE